MSRSAAVTLPFGGDDRRFRLRIGEWEELERLCGDVGPPVIMRRLSLGEWKQADVRETIRLGLIGGGMPEVQALGLVRRYLDELPIGDHVTTAQAIVAAGIVGCPDEPVGES